MANSNKVAASVSVKLEIDYALERISFWFDRHQQTGSEFAKESLNFWCARVDMLDALLPPVKTNIDYTPKKSAVDDWDNEPTFGQQPPKQEVDFEDEYTSSSSFNHSGIDDWGYKLTAKDLGCINSKSKAKWRRSGKEARRLSNK